MTLPVYIEIPAWGEPYITIATRYAIPALKLALEARDHQGEVVFCIHTRYPGEEAVLDAVIGPQYEARFFRSGGFQNPWGVFMAAHRTALRVTPVGAITVLLNADIVVSNEFFRAIDDAFIDPQINVVATLGVRAEINDKPPPVGASAQRLMRWAWAHRHGITRDCTWPSRLPHVLFLPDDGGVSAHSWYLTPIAMRKIAKNRYLPLYKTIDDEVLGEFRDEEIYYIANGEAFYLELSPPEKRLTPADKPIGVDGLIKHGRHLMRSHVRNFGQRITVLGTPNTPTHPVVSQVLESFNAPASR